MPDAIVRSSIQVVTRMMQLLDALANEPGPVNLKQLASATGLHPSTAHRILNALALYRMVERVEPGIYRLGNRLHELGVLAGANAAGKVAAPPEPASQRLPNSPGQ